MEKTEKMTRADIAKLLEAVRAIDNRKVSPEMVEAWHVILKDMTLEVASEALRLARRDASIEYLEPRHLWGWAKEARMNLQPQDEPDNAPQSMQPKCRQHGEKITECEPCAAELARFAEDNELDFSRTETANIHGELLHQHAVAKFYA